MSSETDRLGERVAGIERGFEQMNERLGTIDSRLTHHDERFDTLDDKIDEQTAQLERRIRRWLVFVVLATSLVTSIVLAIVQVVL